MAKNKTKFFAKRQPKLKVETLESRQLLAGVVGAGDEVASDVTVNGVTFDQVLLNGQSVTVDPDDGQWARLTWRDAQGEIIQAEFTGDGTISVDLSEGFSGPAEADRYNQPGVLYVGGNAQILIEQSGSNSKLNVYSLGGATDLVVDPNDPFNFDASLNPFLDPAETYGTADIKNVKIVDDPNGAGDLFNFFGGGNVLFNGSNGNVGFDAGQTNILNGLNIGGFHITNSAFGTLEIGGDSQVGTVNIIGGNVNNTAGAFSDLGTYDVNFIDGVNASGDLDRAEVHNGAFGGREVFTIETATTYDFTGKSQAEIDDFSAGRTFVNDITFTGDLPNNFEVSLAETRGSLVFTGNVEGAVEVDGGGVGGDLIFEKGTTDGIELNGGGVAGLFRIGSADNGANLGADVAGGIFNDIQIWGNQTGMLAITQAGNITITGNSDGEIFTKQGAGDVLVQGDVLGNKFLRSEPDLGAKGAAAFGTFGSITVEGDVDQDTVPGVPSFLNVDEDGTFGPISILGGGGGDQVIGAINQDGDPGDADDSSGSISVTGTAGKDVEFDGGVTIEAANPGAISISSEGGDALTLGGTIDGTLTGTGFDDTTINGTLNDASDFTLNGGEGSLFDLNGTTNGLTATGARHFDIDGTAKGGTTLTGDDGIDTDDPDNNADLDTTGDFTGGLTASGILGVSFGSATSLDGDLVITNTTGNTDDPAFVIFSDGFESGDTSAWSITTPGELDKDGDPESGSVTFGEADGDNVAIDLNGFTSGSLNITAKDIVINEQIDITKDTNGDGGNLGTVNLNGNVTTANNGQFTVANGAGVFTVDGTLTLGDIDLTFLDLADGDLGGFTVTGKSQLDDTLLALAAAHDIGALSFAAIEIDDATDGALVSEADDIESLTTSGDVEVVAGDFINADSLGDSTIDGDFTLPDEARLVLDGALGNFEVTGNATLTALAGGASDAPAIQVDSSGVITIGGNLDLDASDRTAIVANDGTSTVDVIGGLTVDGKVLGAAGVTDIRASQVGDIALTPNPDGANDNTIVNFNVLAAPNGKTGATNEDVDDGDVEVLAADGSNLNDFSIGNVTILVSFADDLSSQSGTAIFDGDNSFVSMGGIGNIDIASVENLNQRSALFDSGDDAVWFVAGDTEDLLDNAIDVEDGVGGKDTVTNTDPGDSAIDVLPNFTDGEITIGNVSINAPGTEVAGESGIDLATGTVADAGGTIEGLAILSAVRYDDTDANVVGAAGDLIEDTDGGVGSTTTFQIAAFDAGGDVDGKIGTVSIISTNGGLFSSSVTATVDIGDADQLSGLIAAETEVGKVQGGSDIDTAGDSIIVGDVDGVDDNDVENDRADQIIVHVI